MSTPSSNMPTSAVDRIDLSAFIPLRPAEQLVLRAFADDDIARVGLRRPLVPSASISVRGTLVSHLARHGGAARRVQIVGAWVEGPVDLRDAAVPEGLWFFRCVFDASPRFDGARIGGSLSFPGCLLPGLRAEDCTVAGDVALNAGCTVRLDVRLARTTVGGDLNLGRLQLSSGERADMQVPRRLIADGARVAGDALLTDGFESDGDVRLVGVQVVGDLRASAARMSGHVNGEGQRSEALNLDLARVAGNVTLDRGFSAAGGVRLKRARIDGDLDCTQAQFDAFGDIGWRGAVAFALDRARVGGTLVLARLKQPLSRATLADAHVGALHDDATTWGDALVLDGFGYRQLAANAPLSSGFRIQWLERQQPAHVGRDFRTQPWQQLIRAFQRMGLTGAARDVAVANEKQLRRAGRIGAHLPRRLRWLPRLAHRAFGLLAGYGHRPWRVVWVMAALWLGCAGFFGLAAERGVVAPTLALSGAPTAALPPAYPAFSPLAFSLEHALPFVDLQQRRLWTVAGDRAAPWAVAGQLVVGIEVALGWGLCLLGVACAIAPLNRSRPFLTPS
ncbi:MAG TPA: pentapeptide repeat-containing protein [Burkholderiaceae bacterium]|nr:pentapeptide repeat-containing protein [Burkholderiaceae bacterium]